MKSLFITGASGFLGSQVLKKIEAEKYKRIVLLSRSRPILPSRLVTADNIRIVSASIEETEKYISLLDANTHILHLAALTGKANPADYFKINTDGTHALIKAAETAQVSGFVFVSSIAVSFSDRRGYAYAESKECAEKLLSDSTLRYCIVRPTIILGEDSPIWHSFYKLAESSVIILPGSGKVKIQPIDVNDMVDVLFEIFDKEYFNNEVLEVGGPDILSINDFVIKIHNACKDKSPRILHLPLGFIVGLLRLIEKVTPSLLPVNSGQFSSFCNDGTATENKLIKARSNMKTIDIILDRLTRNDNAEK